jgi:hypothetical protein
MFMIVKISINFESFSLQLYVFYFTYEAYLSISSFGEYFDNFYGKTAYFENISDHRNLAFHIS